MIPNKSKARGYNGYSATPSQVALYYINVLYVIVSDFFVLGTNGFDLGVLLVICTPSQIPECPNIHIGFYKFWQEIQIIA